jgi:hypothetical protein
MKKTYVSPAIVLTDMFPLRPLAASGDLALPVSGSSSETTLDSQDEILSRRQTHRLWDDDEE